MNKSVSDAKQPSPRQLIYQVLIAVPEGKVVTYGQVAHLCGLGQGARVVARALKTLPVDTRVPWHRVINAQGRISLPKPGAVVQRDRLESEGIYFRSNKVDLKIFQWQP